MNKIFKSILLLTLQITLSCSPATSNIYEYKISSKETNKVLSEGNFQMNFTEEEWLPWDNQLLLTYRYDTIGNGKIDSTLLTQTGYRQDSSHFYIHPPRSYGLEILEYAPFPIIYFDETKTTWKDTSDIPAFGGWGPDLDNSIFYHEFEVVKRNKIEMEIYAISVRDTDTSFTKYVYNFKNGFQRFNYVILDSLIVNIQRK